MTHPFVLHAEAAAASLRIALVSLGHRASRERYGWAAAGDGYHSPSWQPGGRSVGGHGDPVGGSIAATVRTTADTRASRTYATLAWLAASLQLPAEAPLDAIEVALPRLAPTTAWQLTLWLRDLDDRCREVAGLDGGLVGLNDVTCPACGEAGVYRNAAGLHECLAALCLCAGDGCGCAMPVKAAGVQHIWAPEPPRKPERNEDGLDALRYAVTAVKPRKRDDSGMRGLSLHGFYLDEANYLWDGQ